MNRYDMKNCAESLASFHDWEAGSQVDDISDFIEEIQRRRSWMKSGRSDKETTGKG